MVHSDHATVLHDHANQAGPARPVPSSRCTQRSTDLATSTPVPVRCCSRSSLHGLHPAYCPANLSFKCLQDLAKRYEAKDQKCSELRDKLRVTKAALSSKERELDMAQRLLQKLGQEKAHLRVRVHLQRRWQALFGSWCHSWQRMVKIRLQRSQQLQQHSVRCRK